MKPPVETGITAFARNDVDHEKVPIDGTRTKACMDLIPNLRIPLGRDLLAEIRLGSTSRDPGELFGFFKLQQGSGSGVCNSGLPASLEYNKHYLYCTGHPDLCMYI